jgi:hypothetical protein
MREHDPSFRPGKVGLIEIDAFARRTETIGQPLHTKFESAPAVYQSCYFINLEWLIHSRRQFVTFNKIKGCRRSIRKFCEQLGVQMEFDDRSAFLWPEFVFVCEFVHAKAFISVIRPELRQSFFYLVRMKVLMAKIATCLRAWSWAGDYLFTCAREPINKGEAQTASAQL